MYMDDDGLPTKFSLLDDLKFHKEQLALYKQRVLARDEELSKLRAENEVLITQKDTAWVAAIDAALLAVVRLPVSGRDTAHDVNHAAWVAIHALRGEGGING